MRKFFVKNAKGQTFDMNREDAFFSNPKGLGVSRKTSYEQIGVMWKEKSNILSQKKPSGDMVFDGYEQYDEFLNIVQHTPLTLIYTPLEETYYMDVNTFSINKEEISYKDNFLTCKVTFEGTSPWYKIQRIEQTEISDGKEYAYRYPYVYADNKTGEARFVNRSGMEAYCRISIYGPVKNPSWQLSRGAAVLAQGKILAEIDGDSCIVIDSDPQKIEIAEYDLNGNFIRDRYMESDFDTERFIYIPPGTTELKIMHEGITNIKFLIEVMEFAG